MSAIIIVLTFCLGAPALNLVMPYTQPGGTFIAKFHPASWFVVPLLLLVLQSPENDGELPRRHIVRSLVAMVCLVVWLAVRGKGAVAAAFIDIYLTPGVLLLALSRLSGERARSLLALFVGLAAFNVFIVFIEYAIQQALLPRESYEMFFRPAGLLAHPIVAATVFYCAMFLASRGVVVPWLMRPLMLLFLGGIAVCGVRGPLAMGGLIFLFHIIRPSVPRRHLDDYLIDFGTIALLPVVLIAGFYFGAFDRILELGVWEKSAQSRFLIFDAFDIMGSHAFWHGLDGWDEGAFLALQATGGELVENAFVATVFQAGFPAALVLSVTLLMLHMPVMRRSLLFSMIVVLVAVTTLGFGTKNMIAPAVALCGHWVWRQSHGATAARTRRRRSVRPVAGVMHPDYRIRSA